MKRWQATRFGDVDDVLRLEDVDQPEPGPGEARVRVLAASLALPDLMMVRGEYPFLPEPPASPGQEVVGIVDAAGEGFPHPVGARIFGNSRADIGIGGFAEYTLVPGWSAMPVIDGLSDEQAAGFPGSFHVAHIGLHHRAHLQEGETLLVLGGAGRTGTAATQIGKAMGATVIATARSDSSANFSRKQGADHVLDLSQDSAQEEIDEITGGRGIDVRLRHRRRSGGRRRDENSRAGWPLPHHRLRERQARLPRRAAPPYAGLLRDRRPLRLPR